MNFGLARLPRGAGGVVDNQARYAADDNVAENPRIYCGTNRHFRRHVAGRLDRSGVLCRQKEPAIAFQRDDAGRIERGNGATFIIVDDNVGIGRIAVDRDVGMATANDRCAAGK